MANLNDITNPKASDEDIEDEEEEVEDESQEDPTPEEDDGDKDGDKDGDEEEGDSKPTIPYAYEQAALRSGWKQEDIDAMVELDAEKAEKMFGNLYNSLNQASREFSALGRAKANKPEVKPDAKPEEVFTGVDIDKLRKEYEDNPIIDGVVVPLNEALKKVLSALWLFQRCFPQFLRS